MQSKARCKEHGLDKTIKPHIWFEDAWGRIMFLSPWTINPTSNILTDVMKFLSNSDSIRHANRSAVQTTKTSIQSTSWRKTEGSLRQPHASRPRTCHPKFEPPPVHSSYKIFWNETGCCHRNSHELSIYAMSWQSTTRQVGVWLARTQQQYGKSLPIHQGGKSSEDPWNKGWL